MLLAVRLLRTDILQHFLFVLVLKIAVEIISFCLNQHKIEVPGIVQARFFESHGIYKKYADNRTSRTNKSAGYLFVSRHANNAINMVFGTSFWPTFAVRLPPNSTYGERDR